MIRHANAFASEPAARRLGLFATAALALLAACAIAAPPAPALPPGYVYEMASTPDKEGQGLSTPLSFPLGALGSISNGGDRLLFGSLGVFGGAVGNGAINHFLATRGEESWSTAAISPRVKGGSPLEGGLNGATSTYASYSSEDLTKTIFWTRYDPETGEKLPRAHWFMRHNPTGTWTDLTPHEALEGPSDYALGANGPPRAVTPDLSFVTLVTEAALTPDAVGVSGGKEYVIDTSDGAITLGTIIGSEGASHSTDPHSHHSRNALSSDGRFLFFVDEALYRRDLHAGTTTAINQEENDGQEMPLGLAGFREATPDGRVAFFTSNQPLVDEDTNTGTDLYRWDENAPSGQRLILVSVDSEPDDGTDGLAASGSAPTNNIAGTSGVSDDGGRVYFRTVGQQLIDGLPVGPGLQHLFLWDDGTLKHVATSHEANDTMGATVRTASKVESAVTSDGGVLAFAAAEELAPPQGGLQPCPVRDAHGPKPLERLTAPTGICRQIYLYHADSSTVTEADLVCVSCMPGATPTPSPAGFGGGGNSINLATTYGLGALSEDGRVTFNTRAPLLPIDTNGDQIDAYTYKDGQLDLVSSGRHALDSWMSMITRDGTAMTFTTAERLSGWDTDNAYDAYVVKLDGGLPEPRQLFECEGDACQPPPAVLSDLMLASAGFSMPAQSRRVRMLKCAKNKRAVSKGGKKRCVAKRTRGSTKRHKAAAKRRETRR